MSTVTHAVPVRETAEQRMQRLRQEAQELNPQTIGSEKEIERDTLKHFKAWSKNRQRANKKIA